MKRISSAIRLLLLVFIIFISGILVVFAGEIVEPSEAKILLDEVSHTFEAYNIDQNNYFKLRDLAAALKETEKCFDVSYDAVKGAILIETNKPYTGSVGEEASIKGRVKIAEISNTPIFVDGQQVFLSSLNIDKSTYFKLRDIMELLNIGVDWDGKTKTISADTEKPYIAPVSLPLAGRLICVDPGHGKFEKPRQEPIAPNAKETKRAFSTGTQGAQYSEAQVNLAVSLLLRDQLKAQGAQVLMTREGPDSPGSNAERAQIANNANVDMVIRVHCDGSTNKSRSGMSMLVPSSKYVNPEIAKISYEMGETVLNSTLKTTGAANGGVVVREDLTGFNWSTVPTILIEMGFMTNAAEDQKLSTWEYQQKLATGLSTGMTEYFKGKEPSPSNIPKPKLEKNNSPISIRVDNYMKNNLGMSQKEALWKVKVDLDKPEFTETRVLTAEELKSNAIIVNKRNRVPDGYAPEDLVKVTDRVSLRAETKTAFDKMVADAKGQGYKITPVSGYRTVEYQKGLYNRYLKTDSFANVETYSARAGFSEHHTGMAVDVTGENSSMIDFGATKESGWVHENAYKYGFIVRYLPDMGYITGYKSEPWHLRYVGIDIATEMKKQGIKTLEEYAGKFLL